MKLKEYLWINLLGLPIYLLCFLAPKTSEERCNLLAGEYFIINSQTWTKNQYK